MNPLPTPVADPLEGKAQEILRAALRKTKQPREIPIIVQQKTASETAMNVQDLLEKIAESNEPATREDIATQVMFAAFCDEIEKTAGTSLSDMEKQAFWGALKKMFAGGGARAARAGGQQAAKSHAKHIAGVGMVSRGTQTMKRTAPGRSFGARGATGISSDEAKRLYGANA